MLAARLPGILQPLSPVKAFETSMVYLLAGLTQDGGISRQRQFREPHHTASTAAIVGGGATQSRGKFRWHIMAFCLWMNFPSFRANF